VPATARRVFSGVYDPCGRADDARARVSRRGAGRAARAAAPSTVSTSAAVGARWRSPWRDSSLSHLKPSTKPCLPFGEITRISNVSTLTIRAERLANRPTSRGRSSRPRVAGRRSRHHTRNGRFRAVATGTPPSRLARCCSPVKGSPRAGRTRHSPIGAQRDHVVDVRRHIQVGRRGRLTGDPPPRAGGQHVCRARWCGNARGGVALGVFAGFSHLRRLSGHAPWLPQRARMRARPQPDARRAVPNSADLLDGRDLPGGPATRPQGRARR
jgi:hypothetical protein